MLEVVFTSECDALVDLAESVSRAILQPLYLIQSPMIGEWYSSIDYSPLVEAADDGDYESAKRKTDEQRPPIDVSITSNWPDMAEPPTYSGGAKFIVRLRGPAEASAKYATLLETAAIGLIRVDGTAG